MRVRSSNICRAERLEERRLFSSGMIAAVSAGVATIGFETAGDEIELSATGNTLTATNADGTLVQLSDVSSIIINAAAGPNVLNINGLLGTSIPIELQTGRIVLDPSGASDVNAIILNSLRVDAGAQVSLAASVVAGTHYVLVLNQLDLAAGAGSAPAGTLDLAGNDLIVHSIDAASSATTLSTVNSELSTGYNGGAWTGPGIDEPQESILGTPGAALADASGTFDGVAVTTTDLLVKQTLFGDANLDGIVDGSDYTRIDNGYLNQLTGWANGDFNYDGSVDGSDYTLIDNSFNTQTITATLPVTTSFPSSASSLYLLGGFTAGSYQGHNYTSQEFRGRLDTVIVGTSATFQAYLTANASVQITVDGTSVTYTNDASTFQFIPILSGLSDQPHHVIISAPSPGTLYFDQDNTLQVTGADPRLESPAFAGPSGQAQYLDAFSAPFSTYAAFDGDPEYVAGFGEIWPAGGAGTGTGAGIRFRAAVTDISLWSNNNNGVQPRFVLYEDGLPVAAAPAVPTDRAYWNVQPIASGLDGTAVHEYDIVPVSVSGYLQIYGIILGGGSGLDMTTPEAARPQWAFFGDTTVDGLAGLNIYDQPVGGDIRQTDAWMLAQQEGVGAIFDSTGGANIAGGGTSYATAIDALSPAPTAVFLRYGLDDIVYNTPVDTFESDYALLLSTIDAHLPANTEIYVDGILPTTLCPQATLSTYNAAIQSAVSAVNSPRIKFVDTTGWFNPAIDTYNNGVADGAHPDAAGYVSIFDHELLTLLPPNGG